ncbi:hypothetical protein [Adlercreutzia caecimuris]|uniref:hypothetical protein n=1 Tax=Adlercreutzia caecimuris TaxID=671266 RepID=UPI00272D7921|nr:hypothetical protein [Adlercreutzia caecimuris]
MEQQAEFKKDELVNEGRETNTQVGDSNASREPGPLLLQDWMALILAAAALVCAFLPWLQVSTTLVDGAGVLSGLLDSWEGSGEMLPSFQDQYSVLSFPFLAETIDKCATLLKSISATGYLDASEATGYLGVATAVFYAVFAFWAVGVILTIVGTVFYIAGREKKRALFVVGIFLVTALSLVWSCAYNVIIACVDGAQFVIAGGSPWSICCSVLGLAATGCVIAARATNSRNQKEITTGKVAEGASHADLKKTRGYSGGPKITAGIIAGGTAVVLLVAVLVMVAPNFYLESSATNSSAAAPKSGAGIQEQSGVGSNQASVAAVLGGNVLEEQTVTDYIDEFRSASGLTSNSDWVAWMEEQGYTPSSVRDEVLDYFLTEWALEIACEENGIEVIQDDVDAFLAEVKSGFESESEYQEYLSDSGLTEESYVSDIVVPTLKRTALAKKVLPENKREDEEALAEWIRSYRSELEESVNPMPDGLSYDVS